MVPLFETLRSTFQCWPQAKFLARTPILTLLFLLTVPDPTHCAELGPPTYQTILRLTDISLKLRHQSYASYCQLPITIFSLQASGCQSSSPVYISA